MKIFNQNSGHISLKEIQGYLDNELSNKEMHQFEKHLLDCEFCSEALDGYQSNIEALSGDLNEQLKANLDRRISRSRYPKLAIAASIAVVLCTSIVLLFNYMGEESDKVSMTEKSKKEDAVENTFSTDSLTSSDQEETPAELDGLGKQDRYMPDPPIETDNSNVKEEISDSEESYNRLKKEEKTSQTSVQNVIEENDLEEVKEEETEESTSEEIVLEDAFFADEDDSQAFGDAPLVLEEAEKLSPVIERSAASRRTIKQKITTAASGVDQSNENIIMAQNAIPVVGFDSYKLYLNDSLQYPQKAKANGVEGKVILKFEVTKVGSIKDLIIVRKLSRECDLEAKRLILEGPKWTLIDKSLPTKNNIVNLTLVFDLNN